MVNHIRNCSNVFKTVYTVSSRINLRNITFQPSQQPVLPVNSGKIRFFSMVHNSKFATVDALGNKQDEIDFLMALEDVINDLTTDEDLMDDEVKERFTRALQYNVPYNKTNIEGRGLVAAYKMIESRENLSRRNIKLANIMACCISIIGTSFVMTDDIIDGEQTRRGKSCWHTLESIGLSGINDTLIMENATYLIIKKYFSEHHCYIPTIELIHDISKKALLGQVLDSLYEKNGKPRFEVFTTNRYNNTTMYKTAYFALKLPITLAMYLAGKYEPHLNSQVSNIVLKIGQLVQVKNDFLDCYGDVEIMGKAGTDIKSGKCSWLAVSALQLGTPAQNQVFMEHYGQPTHKSHQIIYNLYEELRLPEAYSTYVADTAEWVYREIDQIPPSFPREIFHALLQNVINRVG